MSIVDAGVAALVGAGVTGVVAIAVQVLGGCVGRRHVADGLVRAS